MDLIINSHFRWPTIGDYKEIIRRMFHQKRTGWHPRSYRWGWEGGGGGDGRVGPQRPEVHRQWEPFDGSGVNVLTIWCHPQPRPPPVGSWKFHQLLQLSFLNDIFRTKMIICCSSICLSFLTSFFLSFFLFSICFQRPLLLRFHRVPLQFQHGTARNAP